MNLEQNIVQVHIEDIIPNRFQPRLNFDEEGLKELSDSIKEHGIIQPLVLRRLGDKYEIIAGERRYKASKIAGLTSVPAIISNLDDKQSAEVAIVENVQRKDLSAIEEARSYKALLDKGYLTQEELAKKMGLSQSAISNKLRLLSLSNNVQQALMDEKISERHARSLLRVNSHEEQDKWLQKIIDERLTVRALDNKLVNETKKVQEEEKEVKVVNNDVENIITTNNVPTVDEIRENAKDIISVKEPEVVDTMFNEPEKQKVPNKFFNFLEDEEINMNVDEPKEETPIEPEEIEMLDFLAPTEATIPEKSDLDKIFDEFMINLKEKGYNPSLEKIDKKYIIELKDV